MVLGLFLICMTCLGLAIAGTVVRSPGQGARRRDLELERHPERVQHGDVEARLLAGGVSAPAVERVMRLARDRRFSARTLWRWIGAHGVDKLVVVVDAGLAEDAMLEHLDAGTAPRWESLRVFARLSEDSLPAGMPIAELLDLDSIPTLDDLTFPTELADWSTDATGPGRSPLPSTADWESDGDGGWSSVA
ncbi:hypothetical protein [Nocardioides sp. T2.26MG-1]|uniref:hypothetical protein n=1 Tax=Nocardioides sp. T2.26MG-1 TaxID=3041166 RepID=UPI0024776B9A|nr:hypothetical protein [Nocardioides sp. T2.26MG-1]CAI9415091.1 hypothetical protein HIDPHFAB_02435 [Nocardioides sp. T2.26MG-1]